MAWYRLHMRRAALIVVASLAAPAGCAEGDKDVPFAASDASIDVPVDTSGTADAVPEATCTPEGGVTCTVFPQCGCSGSQNCNLTSASGATCVASGPDSVHEPCGGPGECQKGMQCLSGLCVPFCATDADCTMAGSPKCTSMDLPGLKVCLAQCDVQSPSAVCGTNTGCFFPLPGDETTECSAAGTSMEKGGCTANKFACAPGYLCVNNADCFKWCRIGVTGDCVSGRTCTPFTPKVTKGTIEYGTCVY